MINKLKHRITSDKLSERIISAYIAFIIVFFLVMTISYFILPEGLLKNKNPLQSWEVSSNVLIGTLQIFFYNMISVILILFGNLFTSRRKENQPFIPIGYNGFLILIIINGIVLGTWSFSEVEISAPPLINRYFRTFDLLNRSGLWEMTGQLMITTATAKISIIITDCKNTTAKKLKDIHLSRNEILLFIFGIILMFIGAFIESNSIIY